ncbi:cytochrome c oxidase cbb3-type subunit III [Gammaproteobacteria bacterium]
MKIILSSFANQAAVRLENAMLDSQYPLTVQTTGHTWDGDIQEFNNILPNYWLRGFYATIVFAVFYWLLYPAWPVGRDYTKGIFNQISYQSAGTKVHTHWNSRALLLHALQEDTSHHQEYLQRITTASFAEIAESAELMTLSVALAKQMFGDNCASCHDNNMGLGANLAAASWPRRASIEQVAQAIINNHNSEKALSPILYDAAAMPPWKGRFSLPEVKALAVYIHQLGRVNNIAP